LRGTFRLADRLTLTSVTAYREYDALFNADDDLSPSFNGLGQNDVSFWFFSQELRLSGQVGDTVNWTMGGYYSKQKSVYFSIQDLRYIGLSFQFFQNDPVRVNSKAAFANVSWAPLPGLTVTGGIRYTDEFKNYTFLRRNLNGTPGGPPFSTPAWLVAAVDGVSATFDGPQSTRFDYRASVDYRVSPQLLAYLSISTGFKGGGISPRPFNASQVISFGPEVVTSYEAGLKTDLFDNHLRLNISGFISDYSDIQTPLQVCPSGPPPCGAWANAGDGQYKGIEVELNARPAAGLLIDASFSLLDFHYTSINTAAGGPTLPGGPQLDNPSPSPRWKASGGIQYEFPLGSGAGTLTPRFDVYYQSRSFIGRGPVNDPDGAGPIIGTPGTPLFLGARTVANARLTYRSEDRNWEAGLEVTNLFGNYYYLTSFNLAAVGTGFWKVQPSRPREWALTLTRRF
jgi:iron complex outermembrane receptor protein